VNKKYFLSISTLFVISLIYSRFLVSVCLIAMVILAIVEYRKNEALSIGSIVKDRSYLGLTFVFIAVLLSGFNSEDLSQWFFQIKLKLPFLLLPIAFFVLKPLDQKTHRFVHFVFIGTVVSSTIWVLGNFLMDFKAISLSIGKGKSIPTPVDHIHYSIMVAYALVSSFLLSIQSTEKKVKYTTLGVGIYLFLFMHVLSVRTGLVLSYVGIAMVLGWYILKEKKFLVGIGIMMMIVALPFIAFKTIEPFKRKVNYMYWDFAKYKQGDGKHYNDSERLMSYDIAIDLIKEKPFVGHGVGDLRPIMIEKHNEKFGIKEKYIYPHNQYLYVLTTMGFLGAFLFFGGLLSPLLFAEERNIYLVILFVLMLLSFMVENTVQRALIIAFYLYFILLNLSLRKEKEIRLES